MGEIQLNCTQMHQLNASQDDLNLNIKSAFEINSNGSNDSTYYTPEQPRAPMYIVITATVFYIAIFLFGVLGNILVIVVIGFGRSMKTSVNIFLLNLCIADLFIMLVCMPTALTEIFSMEAWYFGAFMCKSTLFSFFSQLYLSSADSFQKTILRVSRSDPIYYWAWSGSYLQ